MKVVVAMRRGGNWYILRNGCTSAGRGLHSYYIMKRTLTVIAFALS